MVTCVLSQTFQVMPENRSTFFWVCVSIFDAYFGPGWIPISILVSPQQSSSSVGALTTEVTRPRSVPLSTPFSTFSLILSTPPAISLPLPSPVALLYSILLPPPPLPKPPPIANQHLLAARDAHRPGPADGPLAGGQHVHGHAALADARVPGDAELGVGSLPLLLLLLLLLRLRAMLTVGSGGGAGHAAVVVDEAGLVAGARRVDGQVGLAVQPQVVVGLAVVVGELGAVGRPLAEGVRPHVHLAQVGQDQLAGAQVARREEACLAVGGVCRRFGSVWFDSVLALFKSVFFFFFSSLFVVGGWSASTYDLGPLSG